MRISKIELPATIKSIDPNISLASDALREQLHLELNALANELGESVRRRAATYFPPSFTVFVRFSFHVDDNNRAKVTLWIDDPTARWPNSLVSRRAWKLSIPIITHIVKETFEARVKSIHIDLDERKARVISLASARAWNDPLILTVIVTLIGAGYWLLVHPSIWRWLTRAG